MRAVLILAGCVLLSGCNAVITQKPLFTDADATARPFMRPGVWAPEKPNEACAADLKQPISQWPSCAEAMLVKANGDATIFPDPASKSPGGANEFKATLQFIGGGPLIGQVRMEVKAGASVALGDPPKPGQSFVLYIGGRGSGLDAQGRVTRAEFWLVQCGPPAGDKEKPTDGDKERPTDHLLPGLIAAPVGDYCVTDSPAVLRAAAKASEAWKDKTGDPMKIHWVRDGES